MYESESKGDIEAKVINKVFKAMWQVRLTGEIVQNEKERVKDRFPWDTNV